MVKFSPNQTQIVSSHDSDRAMSCVNWHNIFHPIVPKGPIAPNRPIRLTDPLDSSNLSNDPTDPSDPLYRMLHWPCICWTRRSNRIQNSQKNRAGERNASIGLVTRICFIRPMNLLDKMVPGSLEPMAPNSPVVVLTYFI